MNRRTLFIGTLLLSSTMATPALAAHTSRPASVSRADKSSPKSHPVSSEAKCGRCGATSGRGSAAATTPRFEHELTGKRSEPPHLPRVDDDHRIADGGRFDKDDRRHDRDHDRDRGRDRDDRHRDLDDGRRHNDFGSHNRSHYEERNLLFHGHEFAHRTYYVHGVAYSHFYQHYNYRGIAFEVYAPHYYYNPAFYGWAYAPWRAPVAWEWGWAGDPWYRYYGGWFRPYPIYTSPALWLTDYLLAQTLEAAYESRIEAATAGPDTQAAGSAPMTPEVKQAIAEEVRRQLALENSEAATSHQNLPDPGSSGVARMLSDHTAHVFVASDRLAIPSTDGQCGISEGDVIQLSGPVDSDATTANLVVLASKGSDCHKGTTVTVGLADLQEMQNHMRETIDHGLDELQSKQGKGGMPAAPPDAAKPPVPTDFAAIAPPPDPNPVATNRQ
jgi:hypothetical protein